MSVVNNPNKIGDVLVVDIETGNHDLNGDKFKPENCMICEIGIVNLNFETGKINTVFNQMCRESTLCSSSSWVFEKTSLRFDEIAKSQHLNNLRDEIQGLFNEKPVTSWNTKFDLGQLEYPERGFKIPIKIADPMKTLIPFLKIPSCSGVGFKPPKLEEAFEYFNPNKKYVQEHRAISDAITAAKVMYQAANNWPRLKKIWKKSITQDHV